jgi:hypothetical protein
MIKNRWIIPEGSNQHSKFILEYLNYSDCKTLEDLLNLPVDDIAKLLDSFELHLLTKNTVSTVQSKIRCIEKFYHYHKFRFKRHPSYYS